MHSSKIKSFGQSSPCQKTDIYELPEASPSEIAELWFQTTRAFATGVKKRFRKKTIVVQIAASQISRLASQETQFETIEWIQRLLAMNKPRVGSLHDFSI